MKKNFRLLIICILLIGIVYPYRPLYSQTYTLSPTLQSYLDNAKLTQNQVYFLGQTVISNTINDRSNAEVAGLINLNLTQLTQLEADVFEYISTLTPGTLEHRNATILHIALHHSRMALNALQYFMATNVDAERFSLLQRYFYDYNTGEENLMQVR